MDGRATETGQDGLAGRGRDSRPCLSSHAMPCHSSGLSTLARPPLLPSALARATWLSVTRAQTSEVSSGQQMSPAHILTHGRTRAHTHAHTHTIGSGSRSARGPPQHDPHEGAFAMLRPLDQPRLQVVSGPGLTLAASSVGGRGLGARPGPEKSTSAALYHTFILCDWHCTPPPPPLPLLLLHRVFVWHCAHPTPPFLLHPAFCTNTNYDMTI